MAFDYKKEYKEFYLPKAAPSIVTVPPMNYLAVRGSGDPNEEGGEYKASIGLLYAIASPSGIRDPGRIRLGHRRSFAQEGAGLLEGGILPLR